MKKFIHKHPESRSKRFCRMPIM